jgi:CNT family concentrative nucleoside transporter
MDNASLAHSLIGCLGLLAIGWVLSENRRAVPWRRVAIGFALQLLLAALFLKVPLLQGALATANQGLQALERATQAGTALVFGYLGGAEAPFPVTNPNASFILAFRALPLVVVVSALSALLFYWGILQHVVRGVSWLLQRSLRVTGATGVSVAANIFVGMVEAPLVIRPYLAKLTRSELFIVMTAGMASTAGTVMVLYASVIGPRVPGALGHILIASLMSAAAAIAISLIMVPPGQAQDSAEPYAPPRGADSAMDAITRGTLDGMQLLLNIIAMLIVLVALVSLANSTLSLLPDVAGAPLTLQRALGWLLAPVAWLMGIAWHEALIAGSLLGTKTALNELLAYLDLAALPAEALSARSRLIMTYALCGFANFGSLGIMLGGLATMVPERRAEIVQLGLRTIIAGTLSTCLMGATIGLLHL